MALRRCCAGPDILKGIMRVKCGMGASWSLKVQLRFAPILRPFLQSCAWTLTLMVASFGCWPTTCRSNRSASRPNRAASRRQLSFKDIPPVLIHAITSIEDRRFFDHHGLDIFGIARAVLRNAGDERWGQGGSTITQQLVKNN